VTAKKPKPKKRPGVTYKVDCGCGGLFVTVTEVEGLVCDVFATLGKAGGCTASLMQALGRITSKAAQNGLDINVIIKQLSGIGCHQPVIGGAKSCVDAMAIALTQHMEGKTELGKSSS